MTWVKSQADSPIYRKYANANKKMCAKGITCQLWFVMPFVFHKKITKPIMFVKGCNVWGGEIVALFILLCYTVRNMYLAMKNILKKDIIIGY